MSSIDDSMLDDLLSAEIPSKDKPQTILSSLKDRSIKLAFIGVGQCGSRIIEVCYNYGYSVGAINTASQDLVHISIPSRKKKLLETGLGGSGKDLELGKQAILQYKDSIISFLSAEVIADSEILFLVISGGGGSGAGSVEPMVNILSTFDRPIGVIYVLPMNSDDAASKKNSLTTLARLARLSKTNVISTLIIIDNAKIESMYGNLPQTKFWEVANKAIIHPLHMFNTLTNQPSQFTSLDPMDLGKIMTAGDISLIGSMNVENYLEETALAQAALNSLEAGLLANSFDLKQTKVGGVLVVGSKKVLEQIPSNNINYLFHMISEKTEQANLYKGIYAIDTEDDSVIIYTFLAGLGLPIERINALKAESLAQVAKQETKEQTRESMMALDLGDSTTTTVQDIHQKIKDKNNPFNKLNNIGRVGIIDKRKK